VKKTLALLLLAMPLVAAEKKSLTLEKLTGEPPLVSRGISGTAWRDARRFTYIVSEGFGPGAKRELWQYDVSTGKRAKLLDSIPIPGDGADKDKDAAAKDAGAKDAKSKTLSVAGATWNQAGTALLVQGEHDVWVYDVEKKVLSRLTKDAEDEEYPTFSPTGTHVAFVKKNDLYAVEIASTKATRLTTTGTEHVFNGKLDWVYEEELANRRSGRSYEWSPDGKAIVYLRLDENAVPEYPIVDFLPTNGKHLPQRYPKAGDPNATPTAHIVDLTGKETGSFTGAKGDYIGPEFSWTVDSKSAAVLNMDRSQQELYGQLVPRSGDEGGLAIPVCGTADPAWVNSLEPPRFLKDGSGYLVLSEYTGFLHLYRYGMDGKEKNVVTKGGWMIDGEYDVDNRTGTVYFTATEKDPRERHIYRVKVDGTGFTRLSTGRGHHAFKLAPGGAHYLETFSDIDTPSKIALCKADGTRVALVDEPKSDLGDYALGKVELGSFTGSDGTLFYTSLVKPHDFDPAKKYPVVVSVYGGPHAQTVQDRWGSTSLFDHYLSSKGYLVWKMDNRGSWGRGHVFEMAILKKLGVQELADQLEGIAALKKKPFVDPARIGITGWSYGGFMTLFAATRAGEVFKCAVAGAPVTDWKFYDSIYTERYMKLPKDNKEGYEASSNVAAADKLATKLLIIHGTSDDNVHMQNTIAFVDKLVKARKDFSFVPMPGMKHGPRSPAHRLYVSQRIWEFFEKNL